jgi:sulfhydrogenase subunit beta (sulfur reductase)
LFSHHFFSINEPVSLKLFIFTIETYCTLMDKPFLIEASHFQQLFEVLHGQGYAVMGPTLRQGDLIYGEVRSAADLPKGWTDEQEAGSFRLVRGEAQAFFGCGLGQHSWKQFLFPAALRLWQARREEGRWRVDENADEEPPYAFLGVRACDLAALEVHDRVFSRGRYPDPVYQARRDRAFIVAVNCTRCGGTCFCASLGAGPRATLGFDLALTEVLQDGTHFFLAEVGTARGGEILAALTHRPATPAEAAAAEGLVAGAAQSQGRALDTEGLKEFLYNNFENPHWDRVVERCLTCGNCALTCPTCFCQDVQDRVDVTGEVAERWRYWEVCFSVEHSYIHGGAIRSSPQSRYRQWLTHKLATWVDQYGCLGCIGCGRCITWCPVGIDLTQEVRGLKEAAATSKTPESSGEKAHGNH